MLLKIRRIKMQHKLKNRVFSTLHNMSLMRSVEVAEVEELRNDENNPILHKMILK